MQTTNLEQRLPLPVGERAHLRLILFASITSLAAHAQPTIDLLFTIDDAYRAGSVTALSPDGGVVWRGEVKQKQETAHLSGPVAGATTLRLEWQRADGKRGRRQHGLVLERRILGVEGHATFTDETGQPKLALAFIVEPPPELRVGFTDRDEQTGLATVEISNATKQYFSSPELRVERWENAHWVSAAAAQCDAAEESAVWPMWTTRLSMASMNCVSSPLGPGRYRRVLRLQAELEHDGISELVQFEQPFSPSLDPTPVVMLPKMRFWSVRLESGFLRDPQLGAPDGTLVCACEGLIVAREKHRVRVVMPRGAGWFGDELCLEPPDGGDCEPVLHGGHNAGDFPPYFPVK